MQTDLDQLADSKKIYETIPQPSENVSIRLDVLIAISMAIIAMFMVLTWFAFDRRIPTQDECVHILNSIDARHSLLQFRPWQYRWWYHLFSISIFYPPFVYWVNGAFMAAGGESRLVETTAMSFYTGLMVLASYAAVRMLNGGRIAACAAGLFLSAYPLVGKLSHTFFLDFPALAMVLVVLSTFLWWRKSPPSFSKSVISGLVMGAACLTKQIAPAYVSAIGVYFLLCDSFTAFSPKNSGSADRYVRLKQTFVGGVTAVLLWSPFLAVTLKHHEMWLGNNIAAFASIGVHHSFLGNATEYLRSLPMLMSPVLFAVFVLSFLLFRRADYRKLQTLIVLAVGGFFITCMPRGTDIEMRYLTPFLILPAFFSAFLVDKLLSSTKKIWHCLGYALLATAASTYVSFNFLPYPLPLSPLPYVSLPAKRTNSGNPSTLGYEQWGYPFVLNTINKIDHGKAVILNILPNYESLHTSAFQLFFYEQKNIGIFPTNSRSCTIVGDRVTFDEISAAYPTWYLQKTGDTGYLLAGEASYNAYSKLIDFISHSGKYKLMGTKALPDSSELLLYRKVF
jgi:hypothetical protein